MQYKQVDEEPRRFAVIFETGDELFEGLGDFVKREGVESASFTAIGALSSVRLAWFDWEAKEYRTSVELDEQVELVSLVGDVAENEGKPAVHAHVVVTPSEVEAGSVHTFEMRVPVEEDVPTVTVRLAIPDGVTVRGVEPVAGWKIKVEKADDRVTAIHARGRLKPDFFQRFFFHARMPNAAASLPWKVVQTYRDGTVVRYTGEPGEESASITTVLPPAP